MNKDHYCSLAVWGLRKEDGVHLARKVSPALMSWKEGKREMKGGEKSPFVRIFRNNSSPVVANHLFLVLLLSSFAALIIYC